MKRAGKIVARFEQLTLDDLSPGGRRGARDALGHQLQGTPWLRPVRERFSDAIHSWAEIDFAGCRRIFR